MEYKISSEIDNDSLNKLFSGSWNNFLLRNFKYLENSLFYIYCYDNNNNLIGFANVISDGFLHAFILDVTVSPEYRKKGIGSNIVKMAIDECKRKGIEWLHVDYEPGLEDFYFNCGFKNTKAGIINLRK
jgi:N-acetylglutamate synthase-like GNAT family acetyltransferase